MSVDNGIIVSPVGALEVGAMLGLGTGDVGTLCTSSSINPMAKYKPIRYNKKEELIATDFIGAKFGLQIPSSFAANTVNPSVTWTYNKPVVGTNWMRLLDFENYDHNASAPFAFEVTGAEIGGCVGIPLYVNSSAGTYYSKNGGKKHWRQDTCISLYDILSVQGMSQQGYVNCYLGFCIHDLTQSGTTVIVTRQKIGSISTTVPTIILYSNGTTQSGITYPAIPMLQTQSGRAGHTFRFIAALFQNFSGNETTDAYYVYPDSQQSIDVYSLAFISGIDRKEVVMNLYDTITGLTCTLGQSGMKLERLTDTETFYEYRISGYVLGTFVTPNVWRRNSVGVEIKVSSDYGYVGETNVIYNTAANIRMASHTYSNLRLQYIDVPVHIYKSVPQAERSVKIEAWATNITERIAFDNNPLVIHTTE